MIERKILDRVFNKILGSSFDKNGINTDWMSHFSKDEKALLKNFVIESGW